MVTFNAVKAMVTDLDCGELMADCMRLILLSFIVLYLNSYYYFLKGTYIE